MSNSRSINPGVEIAVDNKELSKVVVSGWLGTALEFMDFNLYSLASALVFNKVFFPEADPAMGFILALGTYGTGYIARLVGAVFFGKLGDRIGRKAVLLYTIVLMGLATTLIGVIPTYDSIGILAPIGLVVLRLVQGFGAGAEIAGAGVMVTEFAKPKSRGFISSLVALGTNCGTLFSSAIWAILLATIGDDSVISWGWRIPFLGSFILMIVAVLIRLFVKESPVMEAKKAEIEKLKQEKGASAKVDFHTDFGKTVKSKSFLTALFLRFAQAGNSGLLKTFFAGYVTTTILANDPGAKAMTANAIMFASLTAFITIPLVGFLGDKVGRRRMYIGLNIIYALFAIPFLMMASTGSYLLITVGYIIALNFGVEGVFALENVTLSELFGSKNRLTSTALAKEIAGLVATGLGPLIAAILAAAIGGWLPVAILMIFYSLCAIVAAKIMPEVAGRDLLDENESY
jgi:MHS family metabolite:H+ symporter-like MFS transporter